MVGNIRIYVNQRKFDLNYFLEYIDSDKDTKVAVCFPADRLEYSGIKNRTLSMKAELLIIAGLNVKLLLYGHAYFKFY